MTLRTLAPSPALLALAALLAVAAGTAGARPAAAQAITGEVLDEEERHPLEDVHIQLLGPADDIVASTLSDARGRFRIAAPAPGAWRIAATLIGYGTTRSDTLRLEEGQTLTVEVRMGVEPVAIEDPVVVTGGRVHANPDIRDFHERRRRGELSGFGHFIHGDDLDRVGSRPTDLLRRVPGVSLSRGSGARGQIVRMRGGCVPTIFVDGNAINQSLRGESLDTYVHVQDIEGIEVYRGSHQPGGAFFDRTGCGLVLVWTRRGGEDGGRPFSWARMAVAFALMGVLFLLH